VGSDATAPYAVSWTDVAEGAHSLTAVAVDNQLASGTSAPIPVTAQAFGGWLHQDVGAVGAAGNASYAGGTFTVVGSGADIGTSADEFHFVYVPVSGNATIVARVASIQNTNPSAKGGVMIRESLAANSRHASMFQTPVNGISFQRRPTTGGLALQTQGALVAAPYWVKLVRSGSTLTGWSSPDGTVWTFVGSTSIALPSSILVGLAVTSRADGILNTSVFDGVFLLTDAANAPPTLSIPSPLPGSVFAAPGAISINATANDADGTVSRVDFYRNGSLIGTDVAAPYGFSVSGLPAGVYAFTAIAIDNLNATTATAPIGVTVSASAPPPPWLDADVGGVAALGSASFTSPTFTVRGSGTDIWNTADEFHFVYMPVSGDATIVARVSAIQNTNAWAKAGVMIRESLAADSRHASIFGTPANGITFQHRTGTGAVTTNSAGPLVAAPYWVKLVRSGSTLTGYASADGADWTSVGSTTISLPSSIFVGLALSSHSDGVINTSLFDGVAVTTP
jgi:hypothetical protein